MNRYDKIRLGIVLVSVVLPLLAVVFPQLAVTLGVSFHPLDTIGGGPH